TCRSSASLRHSCQTWSIDLFMHNADHEHTRTKNARRIFYAAIAVLALCASGSAQPGKTALFEGARLIDGTGRAPIESSAILVENGRITRVSRKGQIKVARGTLRVDLAGKTIVPGLVLLHGHVCYMKGTTFAAENYTRDNLIDHLTRYLYYGIVAMMRTA